MPDLVEARRRNTLERFHLASRSDAEPLSFPGIADPMGPLHECEHGFGSMLRAQPPARHGPGLPKPPATAPRRTEQGTLYGPSRRFEWAAADRA